MTATGFAARNLACMVVLFAVLTRVAAIFVGHSSLMEDPDAYARIAVTWAKTGVIGYEAEVGPPNPTAYRPPLYPWLLSWLVRGDELVLPAVGALHIIMGLATVYLTARVGQMLGLGNAAWLAAIAVAIDPLLIRASQQIMTETVAALMSMLTLWLFAHVARWSMTDHSHAKARIRWRGTTLALALGCALGLAILGRPTAAPWAILILVSLPLFKSIYIRRWHVVAVASSAILVVLMPWTVRNWRQFDKPIWSTTHGGYTLLLANNPSLYQHFLAAGPSRSWDPTDFHAHWAARAIGDPASLQFWTGPVNENVPASQFSEVEDDRLAYRAALSTISREPAMFLSSCFYRVIWLWQLFPYQEQISVSAYCVGLWYLLAFSIAIFGCAVVARNWKSTCHDPRIATWWIAIGLLVTLTMVHAIFWSNMRMRASAMPVVYLLAAVYLGQRKAPC